MLGKTLAAHLVEVTVAFATYPEMPDVEEEKSSVLLKLPISLSFKGKARSSRYYRPRIPV